MSYSTTIVRRLTIVCSSDAADLRPDADLVEARLPLVRERHVDRELWPAIFTTIGVTKPGPQYIWYGFGTG